MMANVSMNTGRRMVRNWSRLLLKRNFAYVENCLNLPAAHRSCLLYARLQNLIRPVTYDFHSIKDTKHNDLPVPKTLMNGPGYVCRPE